MKDRENMVPLRNHLWETCVYTSYNFIFVQPLIVFPRVQRLRTAIASLQSILHDYETIEVTHRREGGS